MKKEKKKPELLAPAGDLERLKWAFLYGADAVYIGGPLFGLRANAVNFTIEEIKEATTLAHQMGKRVYVTVNIILHNKEAKQLLSYLQDLEKAHVDAIIVGDPFVIKLAKEHTNLEIHLSTQQSTLNYQAVSFWKDQGVTRIVMGREASKEDLKTIKEKVDLELETFVHGAMCASLSGRCVLSNFLTNRDANRGGCSQICRWNFSLKDINQKEIKLPQKFTFCTKDLIMIDHLPILIDMGISSFKIEGRMRSLYYIATVVGVYRKVIDEYCHNYQSYQYNKEYKKRLSRCANRESIAQFFETTCNKDYQYYLGQNEASNQDFLGIIRDYNKETKLATIEQRNYFQKGDKVEIFGPKGEEVIIIIDKIYDEDNNLLEVVRHPLQVVKIPVNYPIYQNCLMRKK